MGIQVWDILTHPMTQCLVPSELNLHKHYYNLKRPIPCLMLHCK